MAENASGAVLADIVVADPDTAYAASDLVVSDPATFRVIGEPGALQLALAEGASLDFEAAAQPAVTVSLAAAPEISAGFTPAPANDPSDDATPNAAPTAADGTAATDEDAAIGIDVADLIADAEDADDALTVARLLRGRDCRGLGHHADLHARGRLLGRRGDLLHRHRHRRPLVERHRHRDRRPGGRKPRPSR